MPILEPTCRRELAVNASNDLQRREWRAAIELNGLFPNIPRVLRARTTKARVRDQSTEADCTEKLR